MNINLAAAVHRAMYLGPILLAVAPMWFLHSVLVERYDVHKTAAFFIVVGIEITGIASFHTVARALAWNRNADDTDEPAKINYALALVGLYIGVGILLTAVVERDWTLALFFVLAGVGYSAIALNLDMDYRENEKLSAKGTAGKLDLFFKAAKSRGLNKNEATVFLLQANNDPVTAVSLLPSGERSTNEAPSGERSKNVQPAAERNKELDERLGAMLESFGADPFKRLDVETLFGVGKTLAAQIIRYGQDVGQIIKGKGHSYTMKEQ